MRTTQEIISDMAATITDMRNDFSKIVPKRHGWRAAARRVRKNTLALARLGFEFRRASIKEAWDEWHSKH